jgi:hypothetical protein
MDLLTVVMHELGHVLGDADLPVADQPHDLMAENIRADLLSSISTCICWCRESSLLDSELCREEIDRP